MSVANGQQLVQYSEIKFFMVLRSNLKVSGSGGGGVPEAFFKALIYGLYVIIAIAGYFKWKSMMKQEHR